MPFRYVDGLKKRLVEVWSRTLSTLLSVNGESICVPVFAQGADISNIYLSRWTTGQLDKLSAKVTEIWTKSALRVNHITLNKNVLFCLFRFPQVVQEQTLGLAVLVRSFGASSIRNIRTENY